MLARRDLQARHRFLFLGRQLRQLICPCRQVDDGSVASGVYCIRCCRELSGVCWGGMSIPLEENAPIRNFTDALIRWDGAQFAVIPYHINSPTAHSK